MNTLFVYNIESELVLAVITAKDEASAQAAAKKFIAEKAVKNMFYSTGGYAPESDDGKSYMRHAEVNGLVNPIGVRDGKFNSYVARHAQCAVINA